MPTMTLRARLLEDDDGCVQTQVFHDRKWVFPSLFSDWQLVSIFAAAPINKATGRARPVNLFAVLIMPPS